MATDLSLVHIRLLLSQEESALAVLEFNDLNLPSPEEVPWESWRYRYVKRGVDLVGGTVMLVASALPGLAIAAAIRLTSEGPVFYREKRIGQDGQPFLIWKFRSMRPSSAASTWNREAQTEDQWRMNKGGKGLADPRITPLGRFLRKWSLDELPQVFNVLCGEMSLVGPRPIVQRETGEYGDLLRYYLAARPGLSGLWQVSGRSNIDYDKRSKLDAFYIRNWSLKTDFFLLARTFSAVISRVGAY